MQNKINTLTTQFTPAHSHVNGMPETALTCLACLWSTLKTEQAEVLKLRALLDDEQGSTDAKSNGYSVEAELRYIARLAVRGEMQGETYWATPLVARPFTPPTPESVKALEQFRQASHCERLASYLHSLQFTTHWSALEKKRLEEFALLLMRR